jgi:hypothetical protein
MPVADAHELSEKLTNHSWCLCNGFLFNNHLFLNDAFSEDGAQEYAVYRILNDRRVDGIGDVLAIQTESITFSWIEDGEEAIKYINDATTPDHTTYGEETIRRIDLFTKHERCHHCA